MNSNNKVLNFKEIGRRIRLERERLNLTREKFAEIVELSPFYIGQIERGDRKMSLDTLVKFANTFHVSVDYLLYGSNLHNENIKLEKIFTVLETMDNNYNTVLDRDLEELMIILSRCSKEEINLIKEMVKLILPYINK